MTEATGKGQIKLSATEEAVKDVFGLFRVALIALANARM
jgi:hypothetical protein